MRSLTLAKTGLNKIKAHQKELKQNDVEESMKSIPPGDWCLFQHSTLSQPWIGFVNPQIDEKFSCIQLLEPIAKNEIANFSVESYILKKVKDAFAKRELFEGYDLGARVFYGYSDGLSGLIIDRFKDKAIVQINTAGIDRYREIIKQTVGELVKGTAYFLDNPKYREKEFLPTFENVPVPNLDIEENGIKFSLRSEVMQKVGFYYDHRENRSQLMHLLKRLNKKFERGADLFCYAGAWGLAGLKAGVGHMSFVDQGEFETEIHRGLEINEFKNKGEFYRSDVFKFLDEVIQKGQLFDLVLCDPPAFAKSPIQKDQALEGYSKLHRKVLRACKPGSLVAFSSCTHYVSHDEFQKNVLDASYKENKKLQLIYCGMQGWDHPISSLSDKSSYIKSYFYLME